MLFNSPEFALFYVVVTLLYFVLPHKMRWFLLLAASCYFYMAFVPVYILILGFTIIIDYFAGIYIEKAQGPRRKALLIVSLTANIGILVVFKYFNFLNQNLTALAEQFKYHNPIPFLHMLLPIGLSFHTFQAMSYTIEVYRGKQAAERHFGIYSLYVMFYPQLVAGPIERPQNLLYQFHARHQFDYGNMTSGLRLMAWGLLKKMVIADRLAIVVNSVYADPHHRSPLVLIIGTVFFSFQIYCDFSGYSDIAIGAACTMGFKLMKNFDSPYQSRSVDEFWRRWHISLSTWFKDYLYIPLGGNRVSIPRWYLNLFIVFLASGFWHGANWTFVAWGALHAVYLITGIITRSFRGHWAKVLLINRLPFISIVGTFILVSIAWVFFRSPDIQTAVYIIKVMISGLPNTILQLLHFKGDLRNLGTDRSTLALCTLLILTLASFQWLQTKYNVVYRFTQWPGWARWPAYLLLIFVILSLGVFQNSQFIYFQF